VSTTFEVYAGSPIMPKINAKMQTINLAAFNDIALALGITLHNASSVLAKLEVVCGASTQYGMFHRADVSIPAKRDANGPNANESNGFGRQ